jgi:hypothetical protein
MRRLEEIWTDNLVNTFLIDLGYGPITALINGE